jgi:mRNA-degrading endonuclease RelE of RelBE toxin-antitoxin system
MRDEWKGCRALHFGRDAYRIIWEVHEDDEVVLILRVAGRFDPERTSIYDEPRPNGQ